MNQLAKHRLINGIEFANLRLIAHVGDSRVYRIRDGKMEQLTSDHPMVGLKARALELAQELAAMPRLAVKSTMECIVGGELRTLEQSLADERAAVHSTFGSADALEGFQAFLQKRKPVFNR
ncbi:MAG: enoyl-CoA hydratase-related protein [Polyangiales bacterium]